MSFGDPIEESPLPSDAAEGADMDGTTEMISVGGSELLDGDSDE